MLECPNCHHRNDEGGRFCENCGTPLTVQQAPEHQMTHQTATENHGEPQRHSSGAEAAERIKPYLEKTQQVSKQYFNYFVTVLKKPYTYARRMGAEQSMNGLITIALYAILIPLMVYMGFRGYSFHASFFEFVVKPIVVYFIFGLLLVTYCFIGVMLGKVKVSYREILGRYGAFLVPFVAILVVGLLLAILQMRIFTTFLFIGFLGSIFTIPAFIIGSFKRDTDHGIDSLYSTLLVYAAIVITVWILGNYMFEMFLQVFGGNLPFLQYGF